MAANRLPLRVTNKKNLVAKSQEALRAQTPKIARTRLMVAARELKTRMSKPGKPIKYPVSWDNDKQRIKVIIMLKKAKNIPYVRRQKMEQGWKIVSMKTGYTVQNSVRGNVHVYGNVDGAYQSTIHTGRWPKLRREADIVIKALPKSVQNAMVSLVRKVASSASKEGKS